MSSLDLNARYREYYGAFYWLEDAGLVNIAYNTTEPNIGLGLSKEESSFKCYMFDTGLLISMAFDENGIVSQEIYKKILFDKLSFNEGMLIFFSKNSREDSRETMEIDFLIDKPKITSRHNIIPIEVKSGKNYTYNSLEKFQKKYKDYISEPLIIHTEDLKEENGILYLPIYMTPLI